MLHIEAINHLKSKAKKPWPFKGIEQKIYTANLLLVIMGVALSISLKNWQHFERSGSLVVILGIIVAWRDLSDHIGWFEDVAKNSIDRELSALRNEKETGLISYAIKSSKEEKLTSLSVNIGELTEILRNRLRKIEVFTLVTGTLIWGYGNIFGNLFISFKA